MKKHKNKYKLTFLLLFVSSCGQMLSTQSMLDATFAPSPSISNALASQYNKLRVEFSQEMNVEGLSRGNSYSISQISNGLPLSILEVAILDSRTVQLTTEFQTSSATYLLTVTGVQNKIKANLAYPLNQKQFFGFNNARTCNKYWAHIVICHLISKGKHFYQAVQEFNSYFTFHCIFFKKSFVCYKFVIPLQPFSRVEFNSTFCIGILVFCLRRQMRIRKFIY